MREHGKSQAQQDVQHEHDASCSRRPNGARAGRLRPGSHRPTQPGLAPVAAGSRPSPTSWPAAAGRSRCPRSSRWRASSFSPVRWTPSTALGGWHWLGGIFVVVEAMLTVFGSVWLFAEAARKDPRADCSSAPLLRRARWCHAQLGLRRAAKDSNRSSLVGGDETPEIAELAGLHGEVRGLPEEEGERAGYHA